MSTLTVEDNSRQYIPANLLEVLDVFTIDGEGDLWMCIQGTVAGIEAIALNDPKRGMILELGNETAALKRNYTLVAED